jgi:DNA-binding NarL/FixJ family response regulator
MPSSGGGTDARRACADRRTGLIVGRPDPNEARVAELVAAGGTNREVADALSVSLHTEEADLKRIYRKLGIRSRTELASRFPSPPSGL